MNINWISLTAIHLLIILPFKLMASEASKILVKEKGVTIIADESFPDNLESEIHIGHGLMHFRTEGEKGEISTAIIDVDLRRSVVVSLNESGKPILHLFFMDSEGEVVSLFDLNFDGIWDVRKKTKGKSYIFMEGEWMQVDRLGSLTVDAPEATLNKIHFRFAGNWERLSHE